MLGIGFFLFQLLCGWQGVVVCVVGGEQSVPGGVRLEHVLQEGLKSFACHGRVE